MGVRDTERLAHVRRLAATGEARLRREQARLSLHELADAIPTTPSTLSRWETGESRPRPDAALRWLEVLERLEEAAGAPA